MDPDVCEWPTAVRPANDRQRADQNQQTDIESEKQKWCWSNKRNNVIKNNKKKKSGS